MFKNILHTAVVRFLNAILTLVIAILSSRYLGAEAYGRIALFMLDLSVLMLIAETVAGSAIVYYLPRKQIGEILTVTYLWLALFMVVTIVAGIALTFFDTISGLILPEGLVVWLPILVLLYGISGIHSYVILAKEDVQKYNTLSMIQMLIFAGVLSCLIFGLNRTGAEVYIWSLTTSYTVSALLSVLFVFGTEKNVRFGISQQTFNELWQFGSKAQLASFFHLVNRRFSFYFINGTLGKSVLGVYNLSLQLVEGVNIISNSISTVLFARLSNQNSSRYNTEITLQLLKIAVTLTSVVLLLIIALPASLFAIFGKDFYGVQFTIMILSPGVIALSVNNILSHYFSGTGKPKHNTRASGAGLAFTIILVVPALKYYGLTGAAIVTSLAYFAAASYQLIVFVLITKIRISQLLPSKTDIDALSIVYKRFKQKKH